MRVFEALPADVRAQVEGRIQESGWYPLEVLESFLATARQVLDPASPDFFRRQGRFAAEQRRAGPLSVMVATRALRMRMARVVFRMFYDVGSLEVVGASPETARARIHGFPATALLCERFCGIWEGMESGEGVSVRAEETTCVRRGDAYCEIHVVYGE